jgi:hypothetical protein
VQQVAPDGNQGDGSAKSLPRRGYEVEVMRKTFCHARMVQDSQDDKNSEEEKKIRS